MFAPHTSALALRPVAACLRENLAASIRRPAAHCARYTVPKRFLSKDQAGTSSDSKQTKNRPNLKKFWEPSDSYSEHQSGLKQFMGQLEVKNDTFALSEEEQSAAARVVERRDKIKMKSMIEAAKGDGKLFETPTTMYSEIEAVLFPPMTHTALDGSELAFPPTDSAGEPTVVLLCFRGSGYDQLKTWTESFAASEINVRTNLYSCAPIAWKLFFMKWMLVKGMKEDVAEWLHPTTAIVFDNPWILMDKMDILNVCGGYIFLVDANGKIRWRSSGAATESDVTVLNDCIAQIRSEDAKGRTDKRSKLPPKPQ